MLNKIKKHYDNTVISLTKDKLEVRKFLLQHERKETFLKNLCDQVRIAEFRHPNLHTVSFWKLIETGVGLFLKHALSSQEQKILSQAEKNRIRHKEELNQVSQEIATGEKTITEEMIMDGLK